MLIEGIGSQRYPLVVRDSIVEGGGLGFLK